MITDTPKKYKNILVTGGTGFVGAYILSALRSSGYNIRAIRRKTPVPIYIHPSLEQGIDWVEADILDVVSIEAAMKNVDAVIHAAAIVSFHSSDKQRMMKVNVDGTANIVNAAVEAGVKKILHVSSVAALGRTMQESHVNEEKKWEETKADTPYAKSKHLAEMEVWRGAGEGMDAVIINPSTVLGYGDWNSSSTRIFKNVYEGFPWYTTGINGFVDVEDVARAAILLLESDISEERFVVNSENWTFQQLFSTISKYFNKPAPSKLATPMLGKMAWRGEMVKSWFTGKKPLLTKHSSRIAQSCTHFDNGKILAALPGFSFTPLEESIKRACEKYVNDIRELSPS